MTEGAPDEERAAGADVEANSEALLALLNANLDQSRHDHAERLSWIVVGAFGAMALALIGQAFLDAPNASYVTSVTKDYALLVEGPLGGVLGYFFAVRQKD